MARRRYNRGDDDDGDGEDIRMEEERSQDGDEQQERYSSAASEELDDDDDAGPMTAQERKYAALKPPIASLCSALGGVEQFRTESGEIYSEYSLGDQVVGCLKDLKRFWRMDERDDDRTVARIFHDCGVLRNDLIPILLLTLGTGAKGDRIALACVELIGAMTWPINVVEELQDAKMKDELRAGIDYDSLLTAQREYKSVILRTNGVLRAMFQLMSPSLTKNRRDRTTKDENIISLVLHTFRNLAAIRDRHTTSSSADAMEMAQLQSELVQHMFDEQIFDLLVAIAHQADTTEFSPWNMVALDIFHLIFRSVTPQQLMVLPGKGDEQGLQSLLKQEGKNKLSSARGSGLGSRAAITSRHSRFGTTVAMKANGKQYIMHKQSTLAVGPARTLDQIKKSKAKKIRMDDDLAPPSHLSAAAIQCLRSVALAFIDSAFNPFFSSVLKDIRMERLKVKESDTVRFLYLSRFFLEFFLLVYNDERARGVDPQSDEGHDFDLVAEMTETHSIAFVVDRMKKALEDKPPIWLNLHAGIDCFIQILLVIETLQASGVQDHVDVAEILQNKLYYESATFEMIINVLVSYKSQSHKYLDSVINLSYVMLRMLEKYSKSKAYMYVRKKTTRVNNRKKKRKPDQEDEGDGIGQGAQNEEEDEVDRNAIAFAEHAFEFEKYELNFATEAVLQTCMTYLESYKTFTSAEQMKRIVSLLHRQAVKAKSEGLFFKPTVLELFQRILTDDNLSLAHDPATKDLKKLIEYILRKFFKSVQDKPMLIMEAFFPKSKSQLNKLRLGDLDYYASSEDEGPGFKFIKDREVEVEPGFSLSQQIGIAVAALTDDGDLPLVELVMKQLVIASATRTEIVLTTDGDKSTAVDTAPEGEDPDSEEALRRKAAAMNAGPSAKAFQLFQPHLVQWPGDEQRKAGTANAHFKLLMRLLEWEQVPVEAESSEQTWAIPDRLPPSQLDSDLKLIEDFLVDPVTPQGKTAADLLRKKRKAPVRKRRERLPDLDEDGNEIPEPVRKRAAKKKEEARVYQSAQFIEDSDDDEAADAAFFAREAELRAKIETGALVVPLVGGTKKSADKSKSKGAKAKKNSDDTSKRSSKKKKKKSLSERAAATREAALEQGVSDDDEQDTSTMMTTLKKAAAAAVAARDTSDAEASGSSSPSRKRSASASSTLESSPMSAAAAAAPVKSTQAIEVDSDEDVAPAATGLTKKRRIVLDSDEED